jgi:hypothetical protein
MDIKSGNVLRTIVLKKKVNAISVLPMKPVRVAVSNLVR